MRQPILVWEADNHQHTHRLEEQKPVLIGRHKECSVTLPFNTVSRRHALVLVQNNAIYLRNLSRINVIRTSGGGRVAHNETIQLADGQRFQVGPVTFRLLSLPAEDSVVKIRCAHCRRIVAYNPQGFCPWCGTALAGGQTVGE